MGINTVVYSLSYPLLSLAMHQRGFGADIIGISTALQASSVFIFAPLVPRIVSMLGPMKVVVLALALTAVLFISFPFAEGVGVWIMLRFALGAANNLMWIAGESLVNHLADEKRRGRAIAHYTMALSAGFALGPFMLTLTGSQGLAPFAAAAATVVLSMVPALMVTEVRAEFNDRKALKLWTVFRQTPAPMVTNLVFGATSGIMITFLPIYALRLGVSENFALYCITIGAVGGILAQPLIGRLADRFNRLLMLLMMLVASTLITAMMPLFFMLPVAGLVYFFIMGGTRTGMYSLSVTLMGEKYRGAELASASALFNLMWGLGNTAGPYLGGYAIDWWNPHGVPASMTLITALAIPVCIWLIWRQRVLIGASCNESR